MVRVHSHGNTKEKVTEKTALIEGSSLGRGWGKSYRKDGLIEGSSLVRGWGEVPLHGAVFRKVIILLI